VIGAVVPEEWLPKDAGPAELPGVEVETDRPAPADAPSAGASPATSPAAASAADAPSPAEVEEERDALMAAYLKHRKLDPFDLLGLDEDAAVAEIEDGYLDFSRRFAPWRFAGPGLGELRQKARDLFLAGGRAFGELSDAEQRNSLIIRRRNLREERSKKPARDRFVIKSELLDPEVQFKKGKALMGAGKYREALQQLQFACDCDPQNSDYRAELAYCRFLAHPGDGRRALEELRETLRLDPKSGLAVYYSGMVLGELEDYQAAEEHLRRALKMMMPDRRPIEGLKELQAKQKKSKKKLRLL
jgi:tetratricopeptide (TPR) repeat protein